MSTPASYMRVGVLEAGIGLKNDGKRTGLALRRRIALDFPVLSMNWEYENGVANRLARYVHADATARMVRSHWQNNIHRAALNE